MEHTKHIWRLGILLVAVALLGVTWRHSMIPASFGDAGFYRYDSLNDYRMLPVVHGGAGSCDACHEDEAKAKSAGKHATVSCEVCHAPLAVHVKNNQKIAPMPTDRSHTLCAYCHQTLAARPKTQAQVDIPQHLSTLEIVPLGQPIPEGTCMACHDVHSPEAAGPEAGAPEAAPEPSAEAPTTGSTP